MTLDAKKNFALTTVVGYYSSTATQITVSDASVFGEPPFNWTWWNANLSDNPAKDEDVEMNRVIDITGNVVTLQNTAGARDGVEGTTPSAKNTVGGVYMVQAGVSAKDFDDIEDMGIDVGGAYGWITEHGAKGNGTDDDKGAFDAAVTAGRSHIVCPAGTYRIASDLTLGTGTFLVLLPGALLSPDSTKTMSVQNLIAGNHQVKAGSGTLTIGSRTLLRFPRWTGTAEDSLELKGDLKIPDKDIFLRGMRITTGTAAPSSGTWAQGDIVLNSAPTTASTLYWRCTTAGSPGTWEAVPFPT